MQTIEGTHANDIVEFVFDPKTNTFLVGVPKYPAKNEYMKHPVLARILGYGPRDKIIVGGMFSRGKNGELLTSESSGHYWENWNDQVRKQFIEFMRSKGIEIKHSLNYTE